ncbi:MAG: MmcQ/YjbR family DNA-binding protein [Acidimicrobiales bacterium]|nr:MmcQ/YjbR family DNA-binding protein [Acidimicrobiales bacterium]
MSHPLMFSDDDPILARLRQLCLAMPGAQEKISHGHPAFFTKKIFAFFGGSMKVDGQWVQHEQAVLVLPDPDERTALLADDRFWVPAYLGPGGWIGLDLGDGTNWDEVAELVDESYRNTAGKRLIAQLDSRQH